MKWREVILDPKPAEIAFLFVLVVVAPLYCMVRFHGASSLDTGTSQGRHGFSVAGVDGSGALPFRTNDIDPAGKLQVTVNESLRLAYSANRNIFDFAPKKPVRTPTPVAVRTPAPVMDKPPVQQPVDTGPPPTPPPPPIEGFSYIGLIGTGTSRWAVLKKDGEIYLGGANDIILVKQKTEEQEGEEEEEESKPKPPVKTTEYRIMEIGFDKLVMGYPGKDYRQVIEFEKPKEGSSNEKKTTRSRRRR